MNYTSLVLTTYFSVAGNGTIVKIMIRFLEMFFEAFRSNLPDWPFDNPKWQPFPPKYIEYYCYHTKI